MGRREAPVKNTCPDIDEMKDKIRDIISDLERLGGDRRTCTLEELREANSKLREWGTDMASELEDVENQLDEANDKIERLEEELKEANEKISNLETQTDNHEARDYPRP